MNPESHETLAECVRPYSSFATARLGTFEKVLPELADKARDHTVFLYVDRYPVKALLFDKMKAVYDKIRTATASVEVLINFNLATFMRWGLAALAAKSKAQELADAAEEDEADYQADDPMEEVELATLDAIAGDEYWRDIATHPETSFPQKLQQMTDYYRDQLEKVFPYAASCEIKWRYKDRVPKYMLVFATRHLDGIELMNDGMCKAKLDFLGKQFAKNTLFDITPTDEIPDEDKIKEDLIGLAKAYEPLPKGVLKQRLIRKRFGQLPSKDVNTVINSLLKSERLFSATGAPRVNDDVIVSTSRSVVKV
jgi:three-Cys-motif partner protein